MRAYSEDYLLPGRNVLARSFDYAVYDLGMELNEYYAAFLSSSYCARFERGDYRVLAGMSGIELARRVLGEVRPGEFEPVAQNQISARSQEFWCGWALAYYQWRTAFTFAEIEEFAPIGVVFDLYHPYHEMDIEKFVDRLNELRAEMCPATELKRRREELGMSQSELAERSGVPVRSIQQYEQRQKSINRASMETVIALAKTLHCDSPLDIYERA